MTLTVIEGQSTVRHWSDVLSANYENSGVDPITLWSNALDEAGSSTRGPDSAGEYSSTCPNPGHNGGSGDTVASLRWRQAPSGRLLFSCLGMCDAEDVLTFLGLTFVQLKWPRTEYAYRNDLRELLATHVKTPTAGGKKRFWWEHLENGTQVQGRGGDWEQVLWCLPDLQEHAEKARRADLRTHLWVTEGESDAIAAAAALDAGWAPANETPDQWAHLVTTSADGAGTWTRALTDQIIGLGVDQVTILCDSDEAGIKRGAMITEALVERAPALSLNTLSWAAHDGIKDASDAIDRFGKGWLREANATDDADPYRWPSVNTGWLYEAEATDSAGSPTGQWVLHRVIGAGTRAVKSEAVATGPFRVVAASVDEDGAYTSWEIDLDRGRSVAIRAEDLTGGALDVWNSKHQVFLNTRSLNAALGVFLRYHSQNSPRMRVYEHEGWVTDTLFVTGSGVLIGPAGLIARPLAGPTQWVYGEADGAEAAQRLAEVLTFRTLAESAPVLAWLSGVAVRPHALAAAGSSFVPLLQVPGDSGTGKTTFLRLATRLFGNSGREVSNVTAAGLVRMMALSTQVLWLDDFANYDEVIGDLIRGGLTGGGRTRGTTLTERGVVRDEARCALLNSGESAMGLDERAMVQRSVVVEFRERVQGRLSRRTDAQGRTQWSDMLEMGANRDDSGQGLSRWAGSVVKGLYAASERLRSNAGTLPVDQEVLDLRRSQDGVREAAAWRFVEYGAEVLAEWLYGEGVEQGRCTRMRALVARIAADRIADARVRETTGADMYLVQGLLPKYFRSYDAVYDRGVVARLDSLDQLTPEAVADAIMYAWKNGLSIGGNGGPARGAVQIVAPDRFGVDETVAVAISVHDLATWAASKHGRDAGIGDDRRFVTRQALGSQVRTIADNTWTMGGAPPGKIRVRLGPTSRPHYSVVTDKHVIRAILGQS